MQETVSGSSSFSGTQFWCSIITYFSLSAPLDLCKLHTFTFLCWLSACLKVWILLQIHFFFSHRHSLPHTGSCHHKKCNAPSLQDVKLYPNDHLKNSEFSLLYKFTLTTAHHFSCLAEPGICFMLLVLLEKGIGLWDCCGLLLLSRGGDLIIQSLSSGHSDPFTCRSTDPRVEIYYYSLGTRIAEK